MFFAALASAFSLSAGCGGGPNMPAGCPKDPPQTCPSPAPAYAANVAPVIQSRCAICHRPGGIQETVPFQTYDQVQMWQVGIKAMLEACMMPPADQPQPTQQQWRAILGWIACGAMNN